MLKYKIKCISSDLSSQNLFFAVDWSDCLVYDNGPGWLKTERD